MLPTSSSDARNLCQIFGRGRLEVGSRARRRVFLKFLDNALLLVRKLGLREILA